MTTWTPERIERLTQLVRERLFASQIAEALHVSRNAVIGRVHRMAKQDPTFVLAGSRNHYSPIKTPRGKDKLPRKVSTVPKKSKPKPRHALTVKVEAPPTVPVITWKPPKVKVEHITVLERLPWMCKWPVGHGNGWTTFCGKPRKDWQQGSTDETCGPYCEEHHKLSYHPAPVSSRPRPRPHYAK
jgi:hypothetical protein